MTVFESQAIPATDLMYNHAGMLSMKNGPRNSKDTEPPEQISKWAVAGRFIGIGWYIGFCVVGGILGGIWLDNRLGTSVVFTLVGLFLGLGLATLGTYRMVYPLIKEQQGNKDRRNP